MTRPGDVSVIIASNRGGPYLAAAIESVRQQTVGVREVILVDDGSPEPGLAGVAEKHGLQYVRQAASGVSTARNRGVAHAQGRWIAFLDDDDIWYPTKVQNQLGALARSPEAIACHSDLTIIDETGALLEQIKAANGGRRELLRRGNGVSINTLLVLREALVTVGGFDMSLRFAEDLDLVLRLLQVGDLVKVDRPLVGYRRHAGQVTSDSRASMSAYLRVSRRHLSRANRAGDVESASMLRLHLRDKAAGIADWGADDVLTHLARRELTEAGSSTLWLIANTGIASVPALGRRAAHRMLRRLKRI